VFPCKHGAGLVLLLAREPGLFSGAEPPVWLAEWLDKRQEKQEKKSEKIAVEVAVKAALTPEELAKVADKEAAARAKKDAQRTERTRQAARDLETWLLDVMRAGLAHAHQQAGAFWEQPAARLVDGQLPGLAARVRALPELIAATGAAWPERLLAALGDLYSLTRAVQNPAALPEALRADVQQLTGLPLKKDEVLAAAPPVPDTWRVLARASEETGPRITELRTWLWGLTTNRPALILEYTVAGVPGAPDASVLLTGEVYEGTLSFYPGAMPLRAIAGNALSRAGSQAPPLPDLPGGSPADQLTAYATALGQNPWLTRWPMLLHGVIPEVDEAGRWHLHHQAEGVRLPVSATTPALLGWRLLSMAGGAPLSLFGEWDGYDFRILAFGLSNG
jgi:hypothetical protein